MSFEQIKMNKTCETCEKSVETLIDYPCVKGTMMWHICEECVIMYDEEREASLPHCEECGEKYALEGRHVYDDRNGIYLCGACMPNEDEDLEHRKEFPDHERCKKCDCCVGCECCECKCVECGNEIDFKDDYDYDDDTGFYHCGACMPEEDQAEKCCECCEKPFNNTRNKNAGCCDCVYNDDGTITLLKDWAIIKKDESDDEETLKTRCGCVIVYNSRDHNECRCDDDGLNWICADCYKGEYDEEEPECCGKHCGSTKNLKLGLAFNPDHYGNVNPMYKEQLFCNYCYDDWTKKECKGCSESHNYIDLEYRTGYPWGNETYKYDSLFCKSCIDDINKRI